MCHSFNNQQVIRQKIFREIVIMICPSLLGSQNLKKQIFPWKSYDKALKIMGLFSLQELIWRHILNDRIQDFK